ncbi:MAG: hypothetical protein ACLGIS_16770 [Actinomycetes bacterium]
MNVREAAEVVLCCALGTAMFVRLGQRWVDELVDSLVQEPAAVYPLYLQGAQRLHPFYEGGDADAFALLAQARRLLLMHQQPMTLP